MGRFRGTATATALLLAAVAAAGCGLGAGADVGSVELTVTREFGTVRELHRALEARESDTVMRLLEANAEIETRFGGGFVHSIGGVAEGERDGDPYDWFFFVDGAESPVGATAVEPRQGERIWWDYRNWSAASHVPAVVGSWPAPFVDGVAGKSYPVVVECAFRGSFRTDVVQKEPRGCESTREALAREGAKVVSGPRESAIRILVGTWEDLRDDAAAGLIEDGPAESGVYADFETTGDGYEAIALDQGGARARRLGVDTGLVAATSRFGGPPVWVVTGGTAEAVRAAAGALDAEHLRDRYAVAIEGGEETPLPVAVR